MKTRFLCSGNRALIGIRLCLSALIAPTLVAVLATIANAATPSDAMREGLQHSGDVNDYANILSPADRAALADRCRSLREKTGAGFVIVILNSLDGGDIDDFANKLFKQWGIGEKGKDNGILLLVAMRDRKARFEVGYGLEPILPDALAGRILDDQLFPAFKQQRYADGLKAAVNRRAEIIERGETAPAEARRPAAAPVPRNQPFTWFLFLVAFVAIGWFTLGAGVGARIAPLCMFGALFGGVPLFLDFVASPQSLWFHVPIAAVLFLLGLRRGRRDPDSFRGGRGMPGSGFDSLNWSDFGGGSGSSWGGGGFSGGSGSFGGGGSGGGGASGGW